MVRVPEYRTARTFCSEHREAVRILGAFANLQKATISFIMSVRLSFRGKLGSHSTDSNEILYMRTFRKSVEKIQVLLKSDKNKEHFT
jgi:hypothetical protein